ncbi:P27 family phage terminase small subunit [Bradyrhizobium sp. 41S5]|uniref:P27 family phage terminase small subunit n=1 Tax=Bradyrhizobium sp. 41S5 TaxID=1404443 RepID=UPI001E565001|nr:P27 family phage terminase small subunit [Bradyrhizobium sp. 41S5]UFX45426.1 P27 family phage terminase small subunit [Bradyrhizobium sp. 41S5]
MLTLPIRRAKAYNHASSPAPDPTEPPGHLSEASQAWWAAVLSEYDLQQHQLQTLQAAAEAWDRKEEARKALAEHGLTFEDDKGMIRSRPEVAIERDSRTAHVRCVRELNLHVEPPSGTGMLHR